jgi:biotin---protein ligase
MRSMLSAVEALKAALPKAAVRTLGPADVAAGALLEKGNGGNSGGGEGGRADATTPTAALLVMPGGADLPYTRDLAGAGIAAIRAFISAGGCYLGLCAGAYFACASVDFEPGHVALSVRGGRDLALFPGAALGAAVPGFEYESEAGAAAARLAWRDVGPPPAPDTAAGPCSADGVGRGGGGTGETTPVCFDRAVRDYCNGGPVFTRLDGGPWDADAGFADPATGAPLESGMGGGGGSENAPSDPSAIWVDVIARYAGPTSASAGAGSTSSSPPTSPAPAAAAAGGVAALRARWPGAPSAGVAVLCGTHPELAPASAWLATGGGDVRADTLAAVLDGGQAERDAFWRALLVAAGCEGLM